MDFINPAQVMSFCEADSCLTSAYCIYIYIGLDDVRIGNGISLVEIFQDLINPALVLKSY